MLAPKPKRRRLLEMIQFILTFASACAVVEASRIQAPLHDRPGYFTSVPLQRGAPSERSIGDLARVDRKRREAEQLSSRRGLELGQILESRQLQA